jgi:SAM-dependent methyltransferase
MRNSVTWKPSKCVLHGNRLTGSRDLREISAGSRLVADLNAARFATLLPTYVKGTLLDLGCGKVPLYGVYRDLASEVICVDWPASLHGNRHIDIACDVNRPLPFSGAAFDTVLASDLLEHIYDPRSLIVEIARVLKSGGHVIISTPFMYWLHECPHDYYRLTPFALKRMFEEAGLECVLIESCGDGAHVITDVVAKCFTRLPYLGTPIAIAAQAIIGRVRRSGRRDSKTAFPLNHFAVAGKP